MTKLYALSAREMLHGLNTGAWSARELVEAHYARIEDVNPTLNAIIHSLRDQALSAADACDTARQRGEALGPLAGLPITLKENIATTGLPTSCGMRARLDTVADADALIARGLRDAGAIVIGKTNVPQTLLTFECENAIWGRTLNPWNPARTPGGSSGGEAAAIASGMSPLGIGTDIGGSVRTPAHFSGICALKPTVNRLTNAGVVSVILGQESIRSQTGPMARTVDDLALIFEALPPTWQAQHDPNVPPIPWRDPRTIPIQGMRVGMYTSDDFIPPSVAVRRAVELAADALRAAGVEVVPYAPLPTRPIVERFLQLVSADGGATLREALDTHEPIVPQLKPILRATQIGAWPRQRLAALQAMLGRHDKALVLRTLGPRSVREFWAHTYTCQQERAALHARWQRDGLDAILAPGFATPAIPHGTAQELTVAAAYAYRYNVLNRPAGVVPVTTVQEHDLTDKRRPKVNPMIAKIDRGSVGLPVGVQVVGQPWQEDTVLALMRVIETASDLPDTPINPRG